MENFLDNKNDFIREFLVFLNDTHISDIIGFIFIFISFGFLLISFGLLVWSKRINKKSKIMQEATSKEIASMRLLFDEKTADVNNKLLREKFKEIENFNKLSFKHEWYIFNLQSLALKIRDGYSLKNPDFDILKAVEYVGAAWVKTPDDVFRDYVIVAGHYIPGKKPVYNSKGEKIGFEASPNHSGIASAGYKENTVPVKSFSVGEQE